MLNMTQSQNIKKKEIGAERRSDTLKIQIDNRVCMWNSLKQACFLKQQSRVHTEPGTSSSGKMLALTNNIH